MERPSASSASTSASLGVTPAAAQGPARSGAGRRRRGTRAPARGAAIAGRDDRGRTGPIEEGQRVGQPSLRSPQPSTRAASATSRRAWCHRYQSHGTRSVSARAKASSASAAHPCRPRITARAWPTQPRISQYSGPTPPPRSRLPRHRCRRGRGQGPAPGSPRSCPARRARTTAGPTRGASRPPGRVPRPARRARPPARTTPLAGRDEWSRQHGDRPPPGLLALAEGVREDGVPRQSMAESEAGAGIGGLQGHSWASTARRRRSNTVASSWLFMSASRRQSKLRPSSAAATSRSRVPQMVLWQRAKSAPNEDFPPNSTAHIRRRTAHAASLAMGVSHAAITARSGC